MYHILIAAEGLGKYYLYICCILICKCMQNHNDDTIKTSDIVLRKIYLSLYLKGLCVRGSWRLNRTATFWPPLLWPYQRFFLVLLGCSTGGLEAQPLWDMVFIPASSLQLQLLNRRSWGPPLLGAGSLYSILSPTNLNFLSPGLYNNLTHTLLPVSVTISYSIQPLDSQGYILIFSTGCTCYLHRCISYFDSLGGSEVNIQHISCSTCATILRNYCQASLKLITWPPLPKPKWF